MMIVENFLQLQRSLFCVLVMQLLIYVLFKKMNFDKLMLYVVYVDIL